MCAALKRTAASASVVCLGHKAKTSARKMITSISCQFPRACQRMLSAFFRRGCEEKLDTLVQDLLSLARRRLELVVCASRLTYEWRRKHTCGRTRILQPAAVREMLQIVSISGGTASQLRECKVQASPPRNGSPNASLQRRVSKFSTPYWWPNCQSQTAQPEIRTAGRYAQDIFKKQRPAIGKRHTFSAFWL